jgi:hypothetical protein
MDKRALRNRCIIRLMMNSLVKISLFDRFLIRPAVQFRRLVFGSTT